MIAAASGAIIQVEWPIGEITGRAQAAMKTPARPAKSPETANVHMILAGALIRSSHFWLETLLNGQNVSRFQSSKVASAAAARSSSGAGIPANLASPIASNVGSPITSRFVVAMV